MDSKLTLLFCYFPQTDIDKADQTAREALAQLVPMYDELRHSSKLHLLQSAVSRLLVDMIFDAYFVGLPPEQAAQLEQVETFLKPFGTYSPLAEGVAHTRTHTYTPTIALHASFVLCVCVCVCPSRLFLALF